MSERKASMGDKVYRGDVVKYIRNNISLDTFMKRTVQKADESCWDLCDKLNFVPAIEEEQPERTCVNCGRTVNNGGWYADGRTRCPIEEHYALPKDGYCHLWEKRNVTDDDYPERRTDERHN